MEATAVTVLVFISMYQLSSRTYIHPVVSACIITLFPLLYAIIIRMIMVDMDILDVVQWRDVVTLAIQFATTLLIFYRLDYDDAPTTWIMWGAFGLITVALIIPIGVVVLFYM